VNILPSDSAVGTIGRKSDTNNYFVGNLDELWVFNRPLALSEVQSLRSTNSIVPEPAGLGPACAAAAGAALLRRPRQRAGR
jgi:hypothetical protein